MKADAILDSEIESLRKSYAYSQYKQNQKILNQKIKE